MTNDDQYTDVLDFPGAAALERAGRTEPLDPAAQARAHSLVLGAIAADAEAAAVPAPAVRPRSGRRRLLVAAAAVAAVAAGAAVLPVTDIGGGPAASASAADVFGAMADRAAAGNPSAAPYWKTTVKTWVEGRRAYTDDILLGRDAVVVKAADGRTVTKRIPGGTSWPVGKGEVSWDGLGDLPSEPDALRRALSAGADGPDDAAEQTVQQAGRLLTDAPLSPRLRSALFRVLAKTPGATVTEGVKDGNGRSGTRISWRWEARPTESNKEDWRWEPAPVAGEEDKGGWKMATAATLRPNWIVSPLDGRLLEVGLDPDDRPGHVVQRQTYLYAGPANSTR
ncbi:hypothetical protein EES39_07430 [Streptomyces sp. ADI92-24]|uniref:hypothetical protein n=1 Tax=Streptomyces sp. ADI92-24 TaxID=1522756 RepID=UPI000F54CCFE|nr:hypothetical protein [Streptomyces sp. ADI92-24]RPK49513.1 hypothetical protein EES39_07430 [Streptomyces sp. ADI92-24]